MAAQAAHLVDRILPSVPIRQFVLSFPFELSLLAATKPEVLRALARIHAEELARHYKGAAKKSGEAGKLHAGAVTLLQRFGSSLNLHVHLHTCALDGVYERGRVIVFRRDAGLWSRTATLVPAGLTTVDAFGASIVFSGTTLFVGAPGVIGDGRVFAFERSGTT